MTPDPDIIEKAREIALKAASHVSDNADAEAVENITMSRTAAFGQSIRDEERKITNEAIEQSKKLEVLLEPHISWDGKPTEIERLRAVIAEMDKALDEIANETEVHTKLNQERLCCKFQDIARRARAANGGSDE